MSQSISKKSTLQALNTHMIVALLSLFLTGIALICIGFLFGGSLAELSGGTLGINELFHWITIIIIILGISLIILGTFQSIGLMKRIKRIFDAVLSGKSISQVGEVEFGGRVQASEGIQRGLNIIRPPLRESQPSEAPIKAKESGKKAPSTPQHAVSTKEVSTPPKKAKEEKSEVATEEYIDISLEEALQKIVERYNDPDVAKKFSSWNETLMMEFPDIEKAYLYKINKDEGIELEEGYDEDAAVQVKLSSNIFIKMMTNQINPIKAYSSGELEVSGKMRNLLKLRKLMF